MFLDNLTINKDSTIKSIMELFNKNMSGIVFVIDQNKKLLGYLSDK